MVQVVIDGFIRCLVRWICLDRSVTCVRFRNLKFLHFFLPFKVGEILQHECHFSFLPQSFMAAVAKQTLNSSTSDIVAIAGATGR